MKAFLLAAGFGTRLKPMTDHLPKCLVLINDIPLLEWWFRLFEEHRIYEVLINTHYLADQVQDYVDQHNRSASPVKVRIFHEETLLGSGGTIRANQDFIGNDQDFLICYADNLTNVNLSSLIDKHHRDQPLLTMALFRTSVPKECGIAKLDDQGRIIEFIEKPQQPQSNLANAGIYIADRAIFTFFPPAPFIDFGKDILPLLVNKMNGYEITDYLIDIGTPEKYAQAQKDWAKLTKLKKEA